MVMHHPSARLRRNTDQPTAITDVLVATSGSSYRTGEVPLGTPTCSARSRRGGLWALYPHGEEAVVVWPGGAVAGPPAAVARELNRLGDGHDDLDHAAAQAIRQFLTNPDGQHDTGRPATRPRIWSSPAAGYWLSGPTNQPGDHAAPSWPVHPARPPHPPIPLPDPRPEPTPAQAA